MDKNVRKYLLKVVHGLTDVIPDRKYIEWSYYLDPEDEETEFEEVM